jgi:hypothetical protein
MHSSTFAGKSFRRTHTHSKTDSRKPPSAQKCASDEGVNIKGIGLKPERHFGLPFPLQALLVVGAVNAFCAEHPIPSESVVPPPPLPRKPVLPSVDFRPLPSATIQSIGKTLREHMAAMGTDPRGFSQADRDHREAVCEVFHVLESAWCALYAAGELPEGRCEARRLLGVQIRDALSLTYEESIFLRCVLTPTNSPKGVEGKALLADLRSGLKHKKT